MRHIQQRRQLNVHNIPLTNSSFSRSVLVLFIGTLTEVFRQGILSLSASCHGKKTNRQFFCECKIRCAASHCFRVGIVWCLVGPVRDRCVCVGGGGGGIHVRSTLSCRNPFSLIVTTRLTALPTIGPCPSTHSRYQSILQAFSLSFFFFSFSFFFFLVGGVGDQTRNCASSL